MSIFESVQAILVKSHVWKFGSDWLNLSRVIVVTDKRKKNNWILWGGWGVGGGGRSLLLGSYIWPLMPIFELMSYSSQKSCVKIWFRLVEPFKSYHLNFRGGGRNPLLGVLHVTCDVHFRTWPSYSSQKSCVKIWFGLVEPFKSNHVHKHFSRGGGQKPLLGGLHLTCDAHFRTWMRYSSQKLCVKIWFGLVEIGGMLILRGRKTPY